MFSKLQTGGLVLDSLSAGDLEWMHSLMRDPRGWTHFPAGRHTQVGNTRDFLDRVVGGWERDGLSYWAARLTSGQQIGMGGVRKLEDHWNLGFRVAFEHWNKGFATEIAVAAIAAAQAKDPTMPIVAWVDRGNAPSHAVVRRTGLVDHGEQWEGVNCSTSMLTVPVHGPLGPSPGTTWRPLSPADTPRGPFHQQSKECWGFSNPPAVSLRT
ncbi:MAG: GNAT family N-acetyltransferase [Specibacter sp.]